MSTLYDVAKLAKVSPKTVSRVFNESHLVKEETRLRVSAAVKELDYYPNAIAASLKKQRSNLIGIVIPYGSNLVFQDPNMMEQLRGAHDVLTEEGYDIIISAPVIKKNALNEASRLVKHRHIDGVILYPSVGIEEILKEFSEKKFNFVTLGVCFEHQKTNFVDLNVTPAVYSATKHLISSGRKNIGLINKPSDFFVYNKDDFLTGYQKALAEAEIEYQPDLIKEGDYSIEGGYKAFKAIYDLNPNLDGIICASDPMTYGAIRAIEESGLKVGHDIEVIAGDNLSMTQKFFPHMSAINNPSYEQGKLAARMIIAVIKEGKTLNGIFLDMNFVKSGKH